MQRQPSSNRLININHIATEISPAQYHQPPAYKQQPKRLYPPLATGPLVESQNHRPVQTFYRVANVSTSITPESLVSVTGFLATYLLRASVTTTIPSAHQPTGYRVVQTFHRLVNPSALSTVPPTTGH
ncbi:hypothetical protein NG798_27770 [Ancylothrix sp. C2]|uniref:hypothetical protein n=1 Tax=Ancylothrix sp. D3o TaxID=2953691 RepID=UPI0021BA9E25|nr:hypothetical protein [Ancylothrix sp. D3o]MCT7953600.1 hypothetical protein [Ancylothrix sp. D3o]